MAYDIIANSAQILLGTVFGGVALAVLIESMSPLRAEQKVPLMRWFNSTILSVVGYTILFSIALLVSILIVRVMGLEEVGLLHRFGICYIPSFILTLLCLEFIGYWLQRASHSMPMLWSTTQYIITATKCTKEPQKTMSLGLAYFRERKYSRLDMLLLMPFLPKFASPITQAH